METMRKLLTVRHGTPGPRFAFMLAVFHLRLFRGRRLDPVSCFLRSLEFVSDISFNAPVLPLLSRELPHGGPA
jgi:hypothetical protein